MAPSDERRNNGPGEGQATASPWAAILAGVSMLGPAAQASVPGLYAWALTVAPAAWSRGAPWVAKATAIMGLLSLGASVVAERRWGAARYVGVWGLVFTSSVTWVLAPAALSPLHLDVARGVAGMLGWALFAFACAAPALRRSAYPDARLGDEGPLRPRTELRRGDGLYILGGALVALALQTVGWRVNVPERALLVRVVSLAAGLAIVAAVTSVALARHGRPTQRPSEREARRLRRDKLRAGLPWLLGLAMLGILGLLAILRES
jgi:hypothetical protein